MRTTRWAIIATVLLVALLVQHLPAEQRPPVEPRPPDLWQGDDGPLPATLNQVRPKVQVDGTGHVYRLWVDEWGGIGRHIRFQRSMDGGKSWLPEALMLDRDKPEGARSTSPAFVHDASGRVMVIWRTKDPQGTKDLRFLSSPDHGRTWPGPARTLNREGGAFEGEISADGAGHVYVVWYDERASVGESRGKRARGGLRIFFNRSEDFGKSWLLEDIPLSRSPADTTADATTEDAAEKKKGRQAPGVTSALPRLQSDQHGRVFVAWVDNREGRTEIYFRASVDHGKSWGPELNISRGASSAQDHQLLTGGQGRVFVIWSDSRQGLPDVFFTRSDDGGKRWETPVRLSRRPSGITSSMRPHMALGPDGRLYVAWQDRRNGREDIYVNLSSDGGKSWLDRDIRLDRDDAGTGVSLNPYVVAFGPGRVAVLWEDDRNGFEQILLNHSRDGGRSWLARETRVDPATGPGRRAKLPREVWVDRTGTLHAVWEVWTAEGPSGQRRVEYGRLPLP